MHRSGFVTVILIQALCELKKNGNNDLNETFNKTNMTHAASGHQKTQRHGKHQRNQKDDYRPFKTYDNLTADTDKIRKIHTDSFPFKKCI